MKTLSCRDLGMKDDFVVTGETAAEVKKKMMEHAEKLHRDMLAALTPEEKERLDERMDEILAAQ